MIVRRKYWSLLIALFILGPISGALLGAHFGAPFLDGIFADAPAQTETASAPTTTVEQRAPTSPQVVLPNAESVGLDELAPGRKTAIVVMKSPWCSVCQRQLHLLSKRLHEVQGEGSAVFGLSAGDLQTNRRLARKLGLDFPIASDPGHKALDELGLWLPERGHAMPGVIFLDEDGEVESIHKGRYPGKPQEELILERLR
jgi:peroxiredoxin